MFLAQNDVSIHDIEKKLGYEELIDANDSNYY